MNITSTKITCPDCGGAIEKLVEEKLVQYRCRVGHLYSPETALDVHAEREENILWSAVVILHEGADLADDVAETVGPQYAIRLRRHAQAKRMLAQRFRNVVREQKLRV